MPDRAGRRRAQGGGADDRPRRHPELTLRFDAAGELVLRRGERTAPASFELLELVRRCDGTNDLTALAQAVAAPGLSPAAAEAMTRALLAQLEERGFLAHGDVEEAGSGGYFRGYAHPAIHRTMLRDSARTDAFRAAIEAQAPGKTVLDVGAGSGVLALFAARAGASAVHAVEASALADVLTATAANNDLALIVHEGDAREVPSADVQADLLVSEWLGHLVVTEAMWPAVAAARDRCLKPGGALIPARVTAFLAPFEDPTLRADGPAFWRTRPHGLDLSALEAVERDRPSSRIGAVPAAGLLAPAQPVLELDCATAPADAASIDADLMFEVTRAGTLDGLGGWFTAELGPGVVLDTGPTAPATHWQQHLFPVPPLTVAAGQRLRARFDHRPARGAPRRPVFRLALEVDGELVFDGWYDADA